MLAGQPEPAHAARAGASWTRARSSPFRAASEGAHQVMNRSDEPVRFLIVSEMNAPERRRLSRLRQARASASRPPGARDDRDEVFGYFRAEDEVDYWEGEEPPGGPEAEPAVERVGVVGAGTMGAGIAQVACLGGFETLLHDPARRARARRASGCAAALAKGAERGLWSEDDAEPRRARLRPRERARGPRRLRPGDRGGARGPGAQARAVRPARRGLRRRQRSSRPTPPRCRSPRSPPACPDPERVVGMHFFNPPALMKLVEVVRRRRSPAERVAGGAPRRRRAHGPHAGPRRRRDRLHRQPLRAPVRARGAAAARRADRRRTSRSTASAASAAAFGWARSS